MSEEIAIECPFWGEETANLAKIYTSQWVCFSCAEIAECEIQERIGPEDEPPTTCRDDRYDSQTQSFFSIADDCWYSYD